METESWFLKWWPVLSFVLMGGMAVAGLLMRRSFVSQEQLNPVSARLQTIEQTYAKDREVASLKLQVEKMEEAIRNLPDRTLIAKTQEQLARVEERCKHLDETIIRIERPLQLIIEAKFNQRRMD